MKDSKILEIIKAAHELEMNMYWDVIKQTGEVDGLSWLIDGNVLTENEISTIAYSLHQLSGEVGARIAESDNISRDGPTKEIVITEMIEEKATDFKEDREPLLMNAAVLCVLGVLVATLFAIVGFNWMQRNALLAIFLWIGAIVGLVVFVMGIRRVVKNQRLLDRSYSDAAEIVKSQIEDRLRKRDKDLALLSQIDQCLNVINSRFY